ncbi:purple acid phosphatase [Haematococcus lacustris]|uniref:Purple acid phosphatase n=1 Tax=Haematococcus lacustris TaxID=44745 RepID=A0A699Z3V2_HAELA|nr:purple acid phosphatase [Haematococcus lacustris]
MIPRCRKCKSAGIKAPPKDKHDCDSFNSRSALNLLWAVSRPDMWAAVILALLSLTACFAERAEDAWQQPDYRRKLIAEAGAGAFKSTSVPCNASVVGSVAACFDARIEAENNEDYHWGAEEISYPTDGSPWGVHITGPYPDGVSYLISWFTGGPQIGRVGVISQPDLSNTVAQVTLYRDDSAPGNCSCSLREPIAVMGKAITYMRMYRTAALANYRQGPMILRAMAWHDMAVAKHAELQTLNTNQPPLIPAALRACSYVSPVINHAVVELESAVHYTYTVGDGVLTSEPMHLTSLASIYDTHHLRYPLRVGLMADVGQSENSTATRDHLMMNSPEVIINVADLTYADTYSAVGPDVHTGAGTNQQRWDSWNVLWAPLLNNTPMLNCAGNHELETGAIAAVVNYTTTSFSFPTNYPFQSYAARMSVPGVPLSQVGDINAALYYSTVVGGVIKLITLNNYIPFHIGTPQYAWAVEELTSVDRSLTPWLIVQFHAPIYHSYFVHYKEQECFRSVYEDLFYAAGVDIVLNGHVHAYERTHPVYNYERDTCAPIYVTVGDGGNVEGPYRNYVDEINPDTNKTYCELLTTGGRTPNQLQASNPSGWGPGYQRTAHAPGCPTLSWEPASGVAGGQPLVLLNTTENLASANPVGFCQSSQPVWSAHRDPSFGHAMLNILNSYRAELSWYRNIDSNMQPADRVLLERLDSCTNSDRRRSMLHKVQRNLRKLIEAEKPQSRKVAML